MTFDWHNDTITRGTAVYRDQHNTQDIWRSLVRLRGAGFCFSRAFTVGIGGDAAESLDEAADERRWHHADISPST